MKEITPQQIVDAADAHLGLNGKSFMGNNSVDFALDHRELNIFRNCPACDGEESAIATRKGSYLYRKCKECKTLFTHRATVEEPYVSIYENDFLSLSSELVYSSWAPKIYDLVVKKVCPNKDWVCIAGYNLANEHFREALDLISPDSYSDYNDEEGWDAVVAIRSFETSTSPRKTLKEIFNNLVPGGLFMSYGPAANAWNRNNAWIHLNTPIAGQNKTIFSTNGIKQLAEEVGFEIAEYKAFPSVEEHLILLRKPKNDKISR
jgi:hypothetical protein